MRALRVCLAGRWWWLAVGLLLVMPGEAQPLPEPELKAQIVLRALVYVDWPAAALGASQPLQLCLARGGELADALARQAGQRVNGHPLVVRRAAPDALQGCHAIYVGPTGGVAPVPQALLIGDGYGLTEQQVMLNLQVAQGRVVFDINLPAARRAGLDISTRLLRLARFVRQEPP
jgi:hypothetical protein